MLHSAPTNSIAHKMDVLDLKSKINHPNQPEKEGDFEIHHIGKTEISETPTQHPSKNIEVDFAMFSELTSHPQAKKVIEEYPDAKIIMNANLLTKLASANESRNTRNITSVIFCIGLIIGIIFTWILLTQ